MPKRKTQKEFIEELAKINSDIIVLGEYINSNTPLKVCSKKCGHSWNAKPQHLLRGHGCQLCSVSNHKTHENFVREMKSINPHIAFITKYIAAQKDIKCKCLIDGYEWTSKPNRLLRGANCPRCSRKERYTHEEFENRVHEISPNIEFKEKYLGANRKILCKCTTCGYEWYGRTSHLLRGVGCPKCKGLTKTHQEFIEEMSLKNPNIEILSTYTGNKHKVLCRCKIDNNQWYASPNALLRGTGCPRCSSSKGETKIEQYLINNNIKFEKQRSFKGCKDVHHLPFDFYIPNQNIAIEYDGEQHFRPVKFGGKNDYNSLVRFEGNKRRDNIKNEYCKNNHINLLRIPYTELNNIEKILTSKLL